MRWKPREVTKHGKLSLRAGVTAAAQLTCRSADNLVLQDDPNFLPDFDLMPVDLDRLDFNATSGEESQRTLSPHDSQISLSQHYAGDLIIPPSASSFLGGPVGGFGGLSVRGDSGAGRRFEPAGFLDDDLGISIEPDGTMLMSTLR